MRAIPRNFYLLIGLRAAVIIVYALCQSMADTGTSSVTYVDERRRPKTEDCCSHMNCKTR
jgi:hypothetical protein